MSVADEKPIKADGRKSRALVIAPEVFDPRKHNGDITIISVRTGEHRTCRIQTVKGGSLDGRRILKYRDGSKYFGFAFVNDDGSTSLWSRYYPDRIGDAYYARFAWMFARIMDHIAKGRVIVQVSGRCRRCNRILTHPDSLASGLGPECRKIAGQ